MPRPKVLDSQRQRAAEACSLCRETKKKCSGTAPCTQCQRRGLSRECFITYLPRGFRSTRHHHGAGRQTRSQPQSQPQPQRPVSFTPAASARNNTRIPPELSTSINATGVCVFPNRRDAAVRDEPLSPSDSREEDDERPTTLTTQTVADRRSTVMESSTLEASRPRMLLSAHGERVYIGAAASIAFLQVVRRVVAGQIGPSDFSHSKDSETMLEMETPTATDDVMEVSVEQKLQFLQCYFSVTEAFIDIFDPVELETCIVNSGNGPLVTAESVNVPPPRSTTTLSPLRQASLDLVIAIGAQCTSSQDSETIGRAFFRGAQRQALSEMIQDPDLDMVRTYILMAFYMLGECRRNTAYMYLSVAARAAIALGLHSPSSYPRGRTWNAGDKLRLRVWMTCRLSDKLVNSLLGRPATTIGISEDLGPILDILASGSDQGLDCMIAAYRIVSIIDDINTKLYGEQDVRPAVVEKFLQAIDSWKRDLPPTLRQSTTPSNPLPPPRNPPARGAIHDGSVGVVHVSCLYYFAVMLVSRPMFIAALASQQGRKDPHAQIGEACLDAALYLAQTCVEALEAGLLGNNMCIMKALVFAAGLVLGVESFAKRSVAHEVERAFEGAKQVLAFLAIRSPQARHYLDILTSLSNAIAKQRSRMEPSRASRYVSRLFSMPSSAGGPGRDTRISDPMDDDDGTAPWMGAVLPDSITAASVHVNPSSSITDSPSRWPDGGDGDIDPELFIDWETVNISHWDNFPFRV